MVSDPDLSRNGSRRGARPTVRLDLNILPFVNERALRRAFTGGSIDELGAYPDPTAEPLRVAISARLDVPPSSVWVGNGADDLLERFLRVGVRSRGTVALLDPSFGMYSWIARQYRRRVASVPAEETLPVDELVRRRADAYVVCSPNNPTGAAFGRRQVEELIARTSVPVLLDEAYAEFAGQDFRDLARSEPRVLVVRTFSKAYGLSGIRVGYALGHPSAIRRLAESTPPFHLNVFSQRAAIAALEDPAFVARAVAFVRRLRPRLETGLRRLGWPVRPSVANFLRVGPIRSADRVAARLEAAGWRVRLLERGGPGPGGYLRISVGTPGQIRGLLRALGRAPQ